MRRPREIRQARQVTQLRVAADCGVSIPLVRLYEASDGKGVTDPGRRSALDAYYARLGVERPRAAPSPSTPPPSAA